MIVTMQEVMDRSVANYRKTTGIELRMAIDPDNFLSSELYVKALSTMFTSRGAMFKLLFWIKVTVSVRC